VALIYTNENIEQQVVNALRARGHDVLTSLEAGNANRSIADKDVLAFAVSENRIVITHNRLHFVRLHNHRAAPHAGILVCSVDLYYTGQAQQIHDAIKSGVVDELVRVNRP
jgi:predicted nuclease of predicted toxin-antitoxin system